LWDLNIRIDVEVGFTDAIGVDAILGQADFFEHHQIKFERYKESVEIKPMIQTGKTKPLNTTATY
jgi:hypothetical protein